MTIPGVSGPWGVIIAGFGSSGPYGIFGPTELPFSSSGTILPTNTYSG